MTVEAFLSGKLSRFTVVDIALVKAVYFLFGLFVYSIYPVLDGLDWWFYGLLCAGAVFPLMLHFFHVKGGLLERSRAYLESNSPALQMLLFLSQFFAALMLGTLLPVLVSGPWWLYLALMVVLAIKPMKTNMFW